MNCPVCHQPASKALFQKHGFWIHECTSCRHRFADLLPSPGHLERVYSDEYFFGAPAGYPDYTTEGAALRAQGRRYGKLLSNHTSPGLLLDVGAAAGFILKGFEDSGWRGLGLEPNAAMAAFGREQMGLQMLSGSLEEFSTPRAFDALSLIQVLPHFYDLRQALQRAFEITKPGGLWLVETWDAHSIPARVLGAHWHEYSPPSVLHWFSRTGLRQLLAQFGMLQVAAGRPLKFIHLAHARALLGGQPQSPLTRWLASLTGLLPAHWSLPYPPLDVFWAIFQKNSPPPS